MTSTDTARGRRLPRLARRVPWWAWAAAGLLIVAAIVAALGGFRDRVPSEVPVLELGEAWTGGEVRTTVNGVWFTDTKPFSGYALDGELYIVVDATVENLTSQPTLFGRDAVLIELPGVVTADTDNDGFVEQRTGEGVEFVQPGIPTDVYFLWRVPAGTVDADVPIFVGFFERYPVSDDPVFGDTAYTGPRFVARLETTVGEGPMGQTP